MLYFVSKLNLNQITFLHYVGILFCMYHHIYWTHFFIILQIIGKLVLNKIITFFYVGILFFIYLGLLYYVGKLFCMNFMHVKHAFFVVIYVRVCVCVNVCARV